MRSPLLATVAAAALFATPALAASDTAETKAETVTTTNAAQMSQMDQEAVLQCQQDVDGYIADNRDTITATSTRMLRQELRTLREAAFTFARSGDPEACQMVLEEMHELVEKRAEMRDEAAATTGAATGEEVDQEVLRQETVERYKNAPSIDQLKLSLAASDIIDADVVGVNSESLGTVEDVILDTDQKTISFVLISHGGFLGMGEDVTPVRMDSLRVLENDSLTFLLPVTSEQMDEAPTVERGENGYPVVRDWGQDVEAWWNKHIAG